MNEFSVLKKLVADGVELQFGKLTLCDLSHYMRFRGHRRWQIYYESYDRRGEFKGFYFVYKELDQALTKFLELKAKANNKVR